MIKSNFYLLVLLKINLHVHKTMPLAKKILTVPGSLSDATQNVDVDKDQSDKGEKKRKVVLTL